MFINIHKMQSPVVKILLDEPHDVKYIYISEIAESPLNTKNYLL